LAQVAEPPVEVRVGFDPQGLDRIGLLVERADFAERGLVRLIAAIERLGLRRRADLVERPTESVAEFLVEGLGTERPAEFSRGGRPVLALLGQPTAEPGESRVRGEGRRESV